MGFLDNSLCSRDWQVRVTCVICSASFCKATNIEAMLVSRGAAGFFLFLGVALLVPVVDGMTFPDLEEDTDASSSTGLVLLFRWRELPLVRKICPVAPLKGQQVALVWASEPRERAQL
ncbi:hypothetical protein QE152_g6338 [Popillia japonica]|uniref:Uncharacterized protein n=1 Tax=Popillia japonica TaxID=7064 RepID=A0AAW1MI98_POPJA